ncbi:MAG TPA: hypothetical protein VFK47_23125, partial [Ktedonobacteraceae bacterium]|nr:hypothetical protein [Ktedonobacteraceae bacterium]
VSLVSAYVLQLASRAQLQRLVPAKRVQRRCKEMIVSAMHRLNHTQADKYMERDILSSPEGIIQNELYSLAPEETSYF